MIRKIKGKIECVCENIRRRARFIKDDSIDFAEEALRAFASFVWTPVRICKEYKKLQQHRQEQILINHEKAKQVLEQLCYDIGRAHELRRGITGSIVHWTHQSELGTVRRQRLHMEYNPNLGRLEILIGVSGRFVDVTIGDIEGIANESLCEYVCDGILTRVGRAVQAERLPTTS